MVQEMISRRGVLQLASAGAAAALLPAKALGADEILVGGINDESGFLDISGKPMAQCLAYAARKINNDGGLLGRSVKLIETDGQSNMQLYGALAQQLAIRDKVAVVQGGLISPAREIIRPVLHKFQTLYFYNTQYEGGVCDRNCFCTGTEPVQTTTRLVDYAVKNWGKNVYIVAADFLWGQTLAKWVAKFTKDKGGQVKGVEYLPFDLSNFGATIAKIQAAQPDYVMAITSGTPHLSFYHQWAAAGMTKRVPIASPSVPSYGKTLFEQLSNEELNGIIGCMGYFQELDTPANKEFLAGLKAMYGDQVPYVFELASATYEGTMLWAAAVKLAGTIDRMKVIEALEGGAAIEGPSGHVTMDPNSHHTTRDIHLAELRDGHWIIKETYPRQKPWWTASVCDLSKDPDANRQVVFSE
jgi:branched-chain amino acid transport system substrate-binding protein